MQVDVDESSHVEWVDYAEQVIVEAEDANSDYLSGRLTELTL